MFDLSGQLFAFKSVQKVTGNKNVLMSSQNLKAGFLHSAYLHIAPTPLGTLLCSFTTRSRQSVQTFSFLTVFDGMVFAGPGCTADMMASLELQTVLGIPSVTGAGDLVDSSAKFPYVTRCSYNTYTQWTFFTKMCRKFVWTNVAVIFNLENPVKKTNAESKSAI